MKDGKGLSGLVTGTLLGLIAILVGTGVLLRGIEPRLTAANLASDVENLGSLVAAAGLLAAEIQSGHAWGSYSQTAAGHLAEQADNMAGQFETAQLTGQDAARSRQAASIAHRFAETIAQLAGHPDDRNTAGTVRRELDKLQAETGRLEKQP